MANKETPTMARDTSSDIDLEKGNVSVAKHTEWV
jgi:hypothetical protein